MIFLSDTAFDLAEQSNDVIRYLKHGNSSQRNQHAEFMAEFSDYDAVVSTGFDTHIAGVDSDYMLHVSDWIEQNTAVLWLDGEPVILEDSDNEDEEI